jgi:hypothetical protein
MNAFKDKTVYHIPLFFDSERHNAARHYEAVVQNGTLIITERVENEPQSPIDGGPGVRPKGDKYPDYP